MRPRPTATVLLLTAGLSLAACQADSPGLERLRQAHPDLGEGIYETLGRWEEVLGAPQTLPQADGGETFFYWPQHGIAVFTHPQYEGQVPRKPPAARRVTSVILPLRRTLEPSFLPIAEGEVARFDRTLDLRKIVDEMVSGAEQEVRAGALLVDQRSSPWGKTVQRLHLVDGEPVALEIRETWWLSHYD